MLLRSKFAPVSVPSKDPRWLNLRGASCPSKDSPARQMSVITPSGSPFQDSLLSGLSLPSRTYGPNRLLGGDPIFIDGPAQSINTLFVIILISLIC